MESTLGRIENVHGVAVESLENREVPPEEIGGPMREEDFDAQPSSLLEDLQPALVLSLNVDRSESTMDRVEAHQMSRAERFPRTRLKVCRLDVRPDLAQRRPQSQALVNEVQRYGAAFSFIGRRRSRESPH